MLANNDWQSAPTGGYLEAFDTAVHSRSASVVPELIALITERPHPAMRKAAMMALDNLTGDDPLLVAELLTTNDSPMAQLPTFRASLLARLDPRDDAHVAELQHYLLDISHGVDELMTFANTFPNANDFAAHYLLTHQPGRNLYEVARVDLAAYGLVRQWQQDPAFASLYPSLQQVEQRLRPFLEDAVAGGFLQSTDVP